MTRGSVPLSDGELHDLYLNLHDQIEDLAGGPQELKRVLEIRRGRRPRNDDGYFEQLTWCVFKSGISAAVVNHKWPNFRRAFAAFSVTKVAAFGGRDVSRLVKDQGIIRYRAKIEATVQNAREMLAVQKEHGSFDRFAWQLVGAHPRKNAWRSVKEIPSRTAESDALSRALKARGFTFVGSTICYAFMQAVGMVNDHVVTCFRYAELGG